ncbi:MAG: Pirin domain protein [Myxococcales bacterium]|nr:Pirin domain protein [Myxococcales bacterium]
MEIQVRPGSERGRTDHGWLESSHTFSFADYYDPRHMGFRVLRVINEDFVAPGRGFGLHPHNDMEIVTYVLEGELAHQDSLGNGSIMRRGDVQRMSAGTGVTHSESNPSRAERLHLLQIWIMPDKPGYEPSYDQKSFSLEERQGTLRLIVSHDGRDRSVSINQDATISSALLTKGDRVEHTIDPNRYAWIQVARGAIDLEGRRLAAGDGAAARGPGTLPIIATRDAEVLVFDLP